MREWRRCLYSVTLANEEGSGLIASDCRCEVCHLISVGVDSTGVLSSKWVPRDLRERWAANGAFNEWKEVEGDPCMEETSMASTGILEKFLFSMPT